MFDTTLGFLCLIYDAYLDYRRLGYSPRRAYLEAKFAHSPRNINNRHRVIY